jgi:ketosteroid isomerase-like protein
MSMGLLRFRSTETIGAMTHPNSELLRRAWAAYDRGDVEAFAACLTDDWRESGPRGPEAGFGTLADERRTMELHRLAFPDKHTEIHSIVADDATVACHCTVTARIPRDISRSRADG